MTTSHTPGPWVAVELPTAIAIKSHMDNVANIQRGSIREQQIQASTEVYGGTSMIDIKAIRAVAEAANLYWPPETEIRSGRWPAIDKLINAMSPQTVIALLDRLEAAEFELLKDKNLVAECGNQIRSLKND